MNAESLADFLLANLIIHWLILFTWFAAFVFAKKWIYRLHSRWFSMNEQHFNAIHYKSIALYKILIFIFCLVPLLATHIVLL